MTFEMRATRNAGKFGWIPRAAVMAFLCAISLILPRVALAADVDASALFEEKYYSTWDEYVEAADEVDPTFSKSYTWKDVADAICEVIESARSDFEAGDTKAANKKINEAYYGYYDTNGFESETQAKISGSMVDAMELQFSKCRTAAKNGDSDTFEEECDTLEDMLYENAAELDPDEETTSSSSSHENIATEIFAEKYYSTWDEYVEAADEVDPTFSKSYTWKDVADAICEVIESARSDFEAGDTKSANKKINEAYYGYYDTNGFESETQAKVSGSMVDAMELQFSKCRTAAKNGDSDTFEEECDTLEDMLYENAAELDPEEETSTTTTTASSSSSLSVMVISFFASFTIILREGFEAILVVGAIIAYLQKVQSHNLSPEQSKNSLRSVYIGSILGIVLSFVMAAVLNYLSLASSASQELIEGITALIAVVVLYWVSNWMVSKAESEAWTSYIKSRIGTAADTGSTFTLAFTAFLAVFREGAEVILFFQGLNASNAYNSAMLLVGFLVGCVALVFVYLAIHIMSVRVPLKPFFLATSILMFVMSISFLGSGLKELIEADVITGWFPVWVEWIPTNDVLSIFGIYPCGTTVLAQLIALAITIGVWIWHMQRNKEIREEAAAMEMKSSEESQGAQAS